jgi:hypothetical protein
MTMQHAAFNQVSCQDEMEGEVLIRSASFSLLTGLLRGQVTCTSVDVCADSHVILIFPGY